MLGAPAIKQVRQLYSPAASDMYFVRDIAFGSDMRCARLRLQRRIEYHCDPWAQYHFCGAKISRRAVRGISLKNLYRPIVHLKGVTHYTLQDTACEKEYEQNCSYSFCFAAGKTCFMEDTIQGVLFVRESASPHEVSHGETARL